MWYYYTLWHSENPVILKYMDLYFAKLCELYQNTNIKNSLKEEFSKLSEEEKREFLLKSDISSLINYIHRFGREEFTKQLEQESEMFFHWQKDKCTFSLWSCIPGTNIRLTTYDNNQSSNKSSHPNHDSWNMVWWGERKEQEWLEIFGRTFEVLKDINKDFYDELNMTIQKIVPFNTSKWVHNSATHKESIGSLYLGYTIDAPYPELTILEALIHESSHNKLNLIMHSDSLILNDKTEKYYSPYRPDARHIYGIYLWVHALVPTIHTLLKAVKEWHIPDRRWHDKIMLFHLKNKIWMKVLQKYAECTELWYKILEELRALLDECNTMIVSAPEFKRTDMKSIQIQAKQHFLDVQRNYPQLQY